MKVPLRLLKQIIINCTDIFKRIFSVNHCLHKEKPKGTTLKLIGSVHELKKTCAVSPMAAQFY